ncbi:MAG: hypothetical protein K8R92_05560 [Planctomycetes bacterium]|nr:hypothetical protein [Planctomycetota bacterium]
MSPGDSFRVKGVCGTYNSPCDGGDDNSRDLDWIRCTMNEPCYITVSLQMADASGANMNGTDTFDLLFIEQGSDSGTAVDLYGEYGTDGCPHFAVYTFPNGTQQARFPVPAGDVLLIVTTAFSTTYADPLSVHGPLDYGLDVSCSGYDNASCVSAVDDCITATGNPGCSDGVCCDLVCGFSPQCCDTAWDANCVADGVTQCGNFIYVCENPWNGAPNDCVGDAELVLGLPAFISFDCTAANGDGPNDVSRLCTSSTERDVWYVVGPTPFAGELLVTMCGQGNTGDAVVSLYDLGASNDIGNPQDLPSKYVACRDDVCDDDGDGNVDLGGPAGINLIGVPAGDFLLVRVGSFLDTGNLGAPGFAGTMEISFRAVFVDHGLQSACLHNGAGVNLGLISGWSTAALPKRWSAVPFNMDVSGTVNGFDFAAFDSTTPDVVEYMVFNRNTGDATYGDAGKPFGSGLFDGGQVIASGSELFDINAPSNVGDDYQQRYFIDLSSPFHLDPGPYYFSCWGAYSDGSSGASFAWLLYGRSAIPTKTTAAVVIGVGDGASATSEGAFPSGTPFGWRSIGGGFPSGDPTFKFYQLTVSGDTYAVQAGDEPGLLYMNAFNLKGDLDPACFGDLDGSGEVDGGDIGLVLLDFGPCPGCSTDLDGSGEVDGGDIGLVLLSFGACM